MEGARKPLLAVSVALFGVVATIFGTETLDNSAGWLLLGVSLTMLIEWAALEIIFSTYRHDDRERQ